MSKVQNIEELQVAADYRLLRKKLKGGGIGSIIFGVIAIGMGFAFISENPVNLILGIIGIFLLAEGIWILRSPSPKGVIIDGIAMCTIGVWNIVVSIVNLAAGAGGGGWSFVLGFFQIYWGIKSFRDYRRFSYLPSQRPSEQSIGQVNDMIKSLKKAKASEAENLIELQMDRKPWKAELTKDAGVFVNIADDDVVFARRNDVDFRARGEVIPGKERKGFLIIGDTTFNVKISPQALERYEAWKTA